MKLFFAIIALVTLISGVTLAIRALNYKTDKHPDLTSIGGFHPRNWIPVWRMKPWFTPKGYKLNVIGISLILLSSLIMIVSRQFL